MYEPLQSREDRADATEETAAMVWTLHEVEDGAGNGVVHWYCSEVCRERETNDYGEVDPIVVDQREVPEDTICETCGSVIHETAAHKAQAAGYEAGKAAGSWVVDGNTSAETARYLLAGIEDGDPAVLDQLPTAPLSGEWADEPTAGDVLDAAGVDQDSEYVDDVLSAYEMGFSSGVEDEVSRSCRAITSATKE